MRALTFFKTVVIQTFSTLFWIITLPFILLFRLIAWPFLELYSMARLLPRFKTTYFALAAIISSYYEYKKYHFFGPTDIHFVLIVWLMAGFFVLLRHAIATSTTLGDIKLAKVISDSHLIMSDWTAGKITRIGAEKRALRLVAELVRRKIDG